MKKSIRFVVSVLLILAICFLYAPRHACAENFSLVGKYDSDDLAVIKAIDIDKKTIELRNHDTGRDYTLKYDNTSLIFNQYGRSLSASLLETGTVAQVTFLSESRHLNSLIIEKNAFSIDRSYGFDLQFDREVARIGNTNYKISGKTLVLIDGKSSIIQEVMPDDTVHLTGCGTDIFCVKVIKGHGYVSLSSEKIGEDDITGAYLEIGKKNINKVTKNMMVRVAAGSYDVHLTGKGVNYETKIRVERDTETIVDTSQIDVIHKMGKITFEITPEEAKVKIDGEETDVSFPINLEYGDHKIEVEADEYDKVEEILHVGSSACTVKIDLKKTKKENDSTNASTSASSTAPIASSTASTKTSDNSNNNNNNNQSNSNSYTPRPVVPSTASTSASIKDGTLIKGYKVYVDAPKGASLYVDNNYIGEVPTSFDKVSGRHTITLTRSGYESKSYTIKVDTTLHDKTYSFPELEKAKGKVTFYVEPENARVYVGTNENEMLEVPTKTPIPLAYGPHVAKAAADGYETTLVNLNVVDDAMVCKITLDKKGGGSSENSSTKASTDDSSNSADSASSASTGDSSNSSDSSSSASNDDDATNSTSKISDASSSGSGQSSEIGRSDSSSGNANTNNSGNESGNGDTIQPPPPENPVTPPENVDNHSDNNQGSDGGNEQTPNDNQAGGNEQSPSDNQGSGNNEQPPIGGQSGDGGNEQAPGDN